MHEQNEKFNKELEIKKEPNRNSRPEAYNKPNEKCNRSFNIRPNHAEQRICKLED